MTRRLPLGAITKQQVASKSIKWYEKESKNNKFSKNVQYKYQMQMQELHHIIIQGNIKIQYVQIV